MKYGGTSGSGGFMIPNFANFPDTNITDPNISTVVSIGVMGSGKSTLANILALRDDQAWIPNENDD